MAEKQKKILVLGNQPYPLAKMLRLAEERQEALTKATSGLSLEELQSLTPARIRAAGKMEAALRALLDGSEISKDNPSRVWVRNCPSSEAIILGFAALKEWEAGK